MKTKFFAVFITVLFVSLVPTIAMGVIAAPSPICRIEAEITKVDDKRITIRVNSVGGLAGSNGVDNASCDGYKGELEVLRRGYDYKVGQLIRGDISFGGDEFSNGYIIENVQTIKALNNNYLSYIWIPIVLAIAALATVIYLKKIRTKSKF